MSSPDAVGTSAVAPSAVVVEARALRILVLVLVPIAVWTLAGLVVMWPGHASSHVRSDVGQYSVHGLTYPSGRIVGLSTGTCEGQAGSTSGTANQVCATAKVAVLSGPEQGKTVDVPLNSPVYASGVRVGQRVILYRVPIAGGPAAYQFADFARSTPLVLLAVLVAAAVIAVARWRGLATLIGLAFAGFVLVKFMFPALVSGSDPVLVSLVGSSAIMFVVLYAAHGFSARTTTALVGTLFGLLITALLGWGATRWAHLTGVTSEDDLVLAATAPDLMLTSVVTCGATVAALGVLNDLTIRQASAVWELSELEHKPTALFRRAMRTGRDHATSTVYTIAFAIGGASFAILLLTAVYDRPLWEVLQTEQLSGVLIRVMVATVGLLLAMPLTTGVGMVVIRAGRRPAAADSRVRAATQNRPRTVTPPRRGSGEPDEVPSDESRRPFLRARRHREDSDEFGSFDYLREDDVPASRRPDDGDR